MVFADAPTDAGNHQGRIDQSERKQDLGVAAVAVMAGQAESTWHL